MKLVRLPTLLVLLLIIASLTMSFPAYSSSASGNGKYYVYELSFKSYENGKLSLSDKVVFKLVEVNETAYKLVPVEVNKTSLLGSQFYVGVVELLQNITGGIINTYRGVLALPQFSFTLWAQPDTLEKAVSTANMLKDEVDKMCRTYKCIEACKYSGNITRIRECVDKCGQINNVVFEAKETLAPLDIVLHDRLYPIVFMGAPICRGEIRYSVSAKHTNSIYTYTLESIESTQTSSGVHTVVSKYSSSGWLLFSEDKTVGKWKDSTGSQHEHVIVYTIRLIDTNDENVQNAMENTTNNAGSASASNTLPSIPLSTETVAIAVSVVAVIAIVAVILKKLL